MAPIRTRHSPNEPPSRLRSASAAFTCSGRTPPPCRRRRRVLVSPLEHPSVAAGVDGLAARGFAVERLRVDARGRLDEDDFARRVDADVALATVQLANHELGNLLPVERLAAAARARG